MSADAAMCLFRRGSAKAARRWLDRPAIRDVHVGGGPAKAA
jgi:hypothetical protein